MPISAKPPIYTVNTGHTHCPAHLYMMDEEAGTTLTDRGSVGVQNMTITGADWTTDATHGPILSFVQANTDYCSYTSVSGLSGTITAAVIVLGQAGTSTRHLVGFGDNSQLDRYGTLAYQGNEVLANLIRFDNTVETFASAQALTHSDWDFVALRLSDTSIDWSLNGSAWTTNTPVASMAGLVASINTFRIGALANSTPASPFDKYMAAAMWWAGSKSDAEIAAIAADPWQFLNTTLPTTLTPNPAALSV